MELYNIVRNFRTSLVENSNFMLNTLPEYAESLVILDLVEPADCRVLLEHFLEFSRLKFLKFFRNLSKIKFLIRYTDTVLSDVPSFLFLFYFRFFV